MPSQPFSHIVNYSQWSSKRYYHAKSAFLPKYRHFALGNHKPILSDLELFCVQAKVSIPISTAWVMSKSSNL